MRKVVYVIALVALLLGAFAAVTLADGTETLGYPVGITLANGSGIAVGGTGLAGVPSGTIEADVPAGATVNQVLIYWTGEFRVNGDDGQILVDGNPVAGSSIGGPAYFYSYQGSVYLETFRADITGLGLVTDGLNSLTIEGVDYDLTNNGAGVMVVYDDGTPSELGLVDGLDLAFAGFPEPRRTTIPQTFTFAAAAVERTAELSMFVGSVGEHDRPNRIDVTVDGVTTEHLNLLFGSDGQLWDTLVVPVTIPAGVTSATVEVVSASDGSGNIPASLNWVAAALSVPLEEEVEGCTLTQGYWKTHSKYGPAPYDATWAEIGEDADFYLSGQSYYEVLWTAPKKGNVYYILAHQFIAAELNVLNGASVPSEVADALTDVELFFQTYTPEDAGKFKGMDKEEWTQLAALLDSYNNGFTGPGHCP